MSQDGTTDSGLPSHILVTATQSLPFAAPRYRIWMPVLGPRHMLFRVLRRTARIWQCVLWAYAWSRCEYQARGLLVRFMRHVRSVSLAAVRPSIAWHWFTRLRRAPLRIHAAQQPYLALKPLLPYINRRWSCIQRMRVIYHSHLLAYSGITSSHRALRSPRAVLARFTGHGGLRIDLRLNSDPRFRKEGEWTLTVGEQDATRHRLALTFAFDRSSTGQIRCYIGCVQGAVGMNPAIKRLTKAMHGLRPVALLMFALRRIAADTGVTALCGISNELQVHRRKYLIHLPWHEALHLNYDQLWIEMGGIAQTDGCFDLPLNVPRRSTAHIPVNKRALYSRRYRMLDEIDLKCQAVSASHTVWSGA